MHNIFCRDEEKWTHTLALAYIQWTHTLALACAFAIIGDA